MDLENCNNRSVSHLHFFPLVSTANITGTSSSLISLCLKIWTRSRGAKWADLIGSWCPTLHYKTTLAGKPYCSQSLASLWKKTLRRNSNLDLSGNAICTGGLANCMACLTDYWDKIAMNTVYIGRLYRAISDWECDTRGLLYKLSYFHRS